MKLNVHDITEDVRELVFEESTEALNDVLVHGEVCDFAFHVPASVRVGYYRAGTELFFQGHISGTAIGQCARCVEEYPFGLETDFSIVLVPRREFSAEEELEDDDLNLSFYEGDEIDLTPLVREQIILALPTRPLCEEACKGLCPHCGANLNTHNCGCTEASGDPRLTVLRNIKVRH